MIHSFHKTLEVLAAAENPLAIDLLAEGLQVSNDDIRTACLTTLIKRHDARGNVEILRSWQRLSPEMQAIVLKHSSVLHPAMRQSLSDTDDELRANSLELLIREEDYSQIPALLNLIENPTCSHSELLGNVVRQLAGMLHKHLHFGKDLNALAVVPIVENSHSPTFLRDAPRIRHQLVGALEGACLRYDTHNARTVVESLLILAQPDDAALKKVLRESSTECRQVAIDLLHNSRHSGVLELIIQSFAKNYPLEELTQAFRERTDHELVRHLLSIWPRRLSPIQQKNLHDVTEFAWLLPEHRSLEAIPPLLHKVIVAFILSLGMTEPKKLEALEWVVKNASTDGRVAATEVLVKLHDNTVQDVVIESLESNAPDVQAWATSQLRACEVPHAIELLIERLDSPVMEVRDAAQKELDDFHMHRVLEMVEQLSPKVCLAVGRLVRKTDPHALEKLTHEITRGSQLRRLRAIRAAVHLGLHQDCAEALVKQLSDADAQIRRVAAEMLEHVPTRAAVEGLAERLNDSSPRVREAAAQSLQHLRERQRTANSEPALATAHP